MMRRKNKGITLISLVITIVIMLILTGVMVSLLFGDNGIITKAKLAKKQFLGEDARQVVEDRINTYIQEKGTTQELDLYDFWYMYNGDEELETYDQDFVIYLFEEGATANFEGPMIQLYAERRGVYSSAVVIYGDYQVKINRDFITVDVKAIEDFTQEDIEKLGSKVTGGETGWNASKGVESPVLAQGMVPVKWNGSNAWVVCTEDDTSWYSYNSSDKRWANVMLMDGLVTNGHTNSQIKEMTTRTELNGLANETVETPGSMFVWIPRYAYRITSNYSTASEVGGTIEIEFLAKDTTISSFQNRNFETIPGIDNWIIHPAFTNDESIGGWNVNLPGIWVAKFEASAYTSQIGTAQSISNGTINSGNIGNYNVRVLPNVISWRNTNISEMYTACQNMRKQNNMYGVSIDEGKNAPHLMKNSEWGAVAYLAQSVNCRGANSEVEVNENESYLTANGSISNIGQSTTGNVYGIYDMSGGINECVASYINEGSRTTYGSSFAGNETSSKYYTVYIDVNGAYGDAIKETSESYENCDSWFNDSSYFPDATGPFFIRGGSFSNGTDSGLFAYDKSNGAEVDNYGFRPVIVAFK